LEKESGEFKARFLEENAKEVNNLIILEWIMQNFNIPLRSHS
jgi:hypothetical protein